MKTYIIIGLIIIVLILYFLIKPYINIGIENINIGKDKWKEDIIYLRDTLPQKHPNTYFYMSEEKYVNDFDDLINDIDNLEPYQILTRTQKILAEINDPHTYINYTLYEILPIQFFYFDEGIYIIGADSEYKELIGAKVVSIGTDDIDTVIQKVSSLCPNLNESCFKYYVVKNIINPYVLKYFNILKSQNVLLTIMNMNGETITKTISIKRKNDIDLLYTSSNVGERPFYLTNNDRHWYTLLDDNHLLYYQNNFIINNSVEKEVIDCVKENSIDTLVIDLRKNSGGTYINQKKFINTISKLQSKKEFEIYILIGRTTFSSAILYINDFEKSTNCVLVGEPPRTGYNHYGDQQNLRLPNSKVNIKFSSTFFDISNCNSDEITPDILINNSFMDYSTGIDPALNYILTDR